MTLKDLVELFGSNDIEKYAAFFSAKGLIPDKINKQDKNGKKVETGEIYAIYAWKPNTIESSNTFNYIHFHKWQDNPSNALDIQINNEVLFTNLLNEVLVLEGFEKYYPRFLKKDQSVYFYFFNKEKQINILLINNRMSFSADCYCIFISQNKVGSVGPMSFD